MRKLWVLGVALLAVLPGCGVESTPAPPSAPAPRADVVATRPHDRAAYTQGLFVDHGLLYESTGGHGASWIRVSELGSGRELAKQQLPQEFFGEGITIAGGRLWQLTWREQTAFIRDRRTLAETQRVSYAGEGWGLCTRRASTGAETIVMSDGSANLTFRDPVTFAVLRTVPLTSHRTTQLNELECAADGSVYANAWPTDHILRINPDDGTVLADYDLGGLIPPAARAGGDVLNGIAQLPGTDRFLITGKLWNSMFEIRFR